MAKENILKVEVSSLDGDFNLDSLLKRVEDLTMTKVLVGVPSSTAGRIHASSGGVGVGDISESASDGNKISDNNAALAYIHNFGSPSQNIPARPFLIPGVSNAIPKTIPQLKKAILSALENDQEGSDKAFHSIGLICQNEVRKKITDGPFVPLKQSTINARINKSKNKKGASAENIRPLIDTGALRQAQTYAIEVSGELKFSNPVSGSGTYGALKK